MVRSVVLPGYERLVNAAVSSVAVVQKEGVLKVTLQVQDEAPDVVIAELQHLVDKLRAEHGSDEQ